MVAKQKSYDCQEGSRFIATDNYIAIQDNIPSCQEGTVMQILSEEHKKKISQSLKGRKLTDEHKRKIGEGNKGKLLTEETKHKLSIVNSGKHLSKETKNKISKALIGRKLTTTEIEKMKGRTPWNKGVPCSECVKKIISVKLTGRIFTEEHKRKISENNVGFRGKKHSDEAKKKMSVSHKGFRHTDEFKQRLSKNMRGINNPFFGKRHTDQTKTRISTFLTGRKGTTASGEKNPNYGNRGDKNPCWKGGNKVAWAKHQSIRRKRGFILIIQKNPYLEKVDYHHIHPNLPYVIPIPSRIHNMFNGHEKNHFVNVCAMLGIKFEFPSLFKHLELEDKPQ